MTLTREELKVAHNNIMTEKLEIPCSYQGGKQRLAKQIVDIFYEENDIDDHTQFYDMCCGSGAISVELLNRGVNSKNIQEVKYIHTISIQTFCSFTK